MEHSSLFPLPFSYLVFFVAISVIVLIVSYVKNKCFYKLSLLAGIILLFGLYFSEEKIWFNIVGIIEFILLGITVAGMVFASKNKKSICKGEHSKTE